MFSNNWHLFSILFNFSRVSLSRWKPRFWNLKTCYMGRWMLEINNKNIEWNWLDNWETINREKNSKQYVYYMSLPPWGTPGPAPQGRGDSRPSAGRGGTRHWRPRCSAASGQTAGMTARCRWGHYLSSNKVMTHDFSFPDPDPLTDDDKLLALLHWLLGLGVLVVVAARRAWAELGWHPASGACCCCFSFLTSLSSIKWVCPGLQRSDHFHHIVIIATSKLYKTRYSLQPFQSEIFIIRPFLAISRLQLY